MVGEPISSENFLFLLGKKKVHTTCHLAEFYAIRCIVFLKEPSAPVLF